MNKLAQAVRLTKQYAAFFHDELSPEQLHHWLISSQTYSLAQIKQVHTGKSSQTKPLLEQKIVLARKVARFMSSVPGIRLIALTGSLAVNNAKKSDDIDLMIITKANALWLIRPFIILLTSLFFKRRLPSNEQYQMSNDKWSNTICLNLWLDESALAVPRSKRNLYTAHEVLQAKPIFDRGNTYAKFIRSNSWTKQYLANAYKYTKSNFPSQKSPKFVNSYILKFLNNIAFLLQYLYMKPRITNETVTLHSAYFHPRDYSKRIQQQVGLY